MRVTERAKNHEGIKIVVKLRHHVFCFHRRFFIRF